MKWKLSLLVVLLLCAVMLPIMANAETQSGTCGDDLTWTLTDDGTLTISGTGNMYNYSINDMEWITTAPWGSSPTNVIMQSGVTSIGNYAFFNCTNLSSIIISDNVATIGNYAFHLCSGLTDILVAEGNAYYSSQDGVLFSKDKTTVILYPKGKTGAYSIPQGVTHIGDSAFKMCYGLTSITIPDSVTRIGDSAFFDCGGLMNITIPNSVTTIGNSAFYFCTGLKNITLPDGIEVIGDCFFQGCSSLTSITIPDSVTSIGNTAFQGCSSLTSITIPNSVTDIEEGAFYNCTSLTDIYYSGTEEEWAAISMGSDNEPLTNATLHTAPAIVDSGTCGDNLTWTLDGNGLLTITGTGPMQNYSSDGANSSGIFVTNAPWGTSATTVVIGDGVTSIGEWAFSGSIGLTDITIPNSVNSIGRNAFLDCRSIVSISVPDGITNIAQSAFEKCSSLSSITIPNSVTVIYNYAFEHCSSLKSIFIPNSVSRIGNCAFYGCSQLTNINLPNSVTSIGDSAFYDCTNLTSITIPNSVTEIANDTFYGCSRLSSIVIPNSVAEIWYSAFDGCTSLNTVYFTGTAKQWDTLMAYTQSGNDRLNKARIICDYTPVCNHIWGSTVYSWSNDNSAVTAIRICVNDSEHIETETVNATAEITLQPTCTEPGETTYTSGVFENTAFTVQTKTLADVDAIGHEWGQPTYTWAEDNSTVTAIRVCVHDSEHIETETVAATAQILKNPTCTTMGETTYTGSSFQNVAFTEQSKTEMDIAMLPHTPVVDAAVAPTCTETGLTEGKHCEWCNEVLLAQEEVPALGHIEVIDEAVSPTCTETGLTEGKHCSRCNDVPVAQEEVPALGHLEVVDAAVAPTCTETGLTEGKHCERCNEVLIAQTVLPAVGHQYEYCPAIAPTCTEEGLTEGFKCSLCGIIEVGCESIPAAGHVIVIDEAVEPTCIQEGLTQGSHCSVCGTILEAQESIPVVAHKNVMDASVNPTCTTEGLTAGFHCQVCETVFVEQRPVPALGHEWGEAVYEWAADDRSVTATHTCTRNGQHVEAETVSVTVAIVTSPTMEIGGKAVLTTVAFESEAFVAQTKEINLPPLGGLQFLRLPVYLTAIEEEAFMGAAFEAVLIPKGCASIGRRAFADCPNLVYVRIPASVTSIADDAFEGCSQVVIDRIED